MILLLLFKITYIWYKNVSNTEKHNQKSKKKKTQLTESYCPETTISNIYKTSLTTCMYVDK